MRAVDDPLAPADFWARLQSRFISRYPGFAREAAVQVPGRRPPAGPTSLVGPAAGRLWEVSFLEPRFLAPDMQVGVTTAVRLVDPADMPHRAMPWLYVGIRPGVFTRGSIGVDRILEKYRSGRGNMKGAGTGDPELDRRWGVYTFDSALADVFRAPDVHRALRAGATLAPNPRGDLPTLAVYGTEATLTLPLTSAASGLTGVPAAFDGFALVLDRLESARGIEPASRRPIPMDVMRDDMGVPFPTPRFACPWCHEMTHPRFQPNLNIEVCEKCRQALYTVR